jgi:hypothetical protein
MNLTTGTGSSVSRRGRNQGSTLTHVTCEVGARVRVTATTGLMAGQAGSIVKAGDTPTVRFKSGQELRIPMRKLQLLQKADGAPPPPPPKPQPDLTAAYPQQRVRPLNLNVEYVDGREEVVELEEAPKKQPIIRRDDADWNF